jgi:hypothetical protein
VRRELTGGALLAQAVHAAGESAALWAERRGQLPDTTRAVVLVATKEQMEAALEGELERGLPLRDFASVITETDGPLAGSTTAFGIVANEVGRADLKRLVGHLRPWRAA